MDRETARQEIRSRISCKDYLTKSKSGLYCCPFCRSGTGSHGTGALKVYDTNTWTCHSCNRSGDVIDLYREQTGADYNTALSLLADEIGVTIDPYRPTAAADFAPAPKNDPVERPQSHETGQGNIKPLDDAKSPQNGAETPTEATADYTAYYQECRQRLNDPAAAAYLQSRGISPETAAAYWLGFDPQADPAQSNHPCPRLIIPTSRAHYIGRRIDGVKDFAKLNPKGSTPAIFNARVLYAQDVQEVFVTEGAFDALSVIEAGAAAIALNSAANADALIKQLEQRRTAATLILCLDNDERGQKATATLNAGLQRLNISHITANICAGYKDPNEALKADRMAFFDAVKATERSTSKPDNTADYINKRMAADIQQFRKDAERKTGFKNLDGVAGGIYAGLYSVGGISSVGKTTFISQLVEQMAEQGQHVLFFSMEQSRLEIVSKSIARRTARKDAGTAVTSLSIRKGYLPKNALDAADEYVKAVGDRLSVIEGNFSCTVGYIREYVTAYKEKNGVRPIVVIDYLQTLKADVDPQTGRKPTDTRQIVESNVTELKRMSRSLEIPVFVISSVNRSNYLAPIDFEAFKESGGIEFTSDVVWGLQLDAINDDLFNKEGKIKEKREKIRDAKAAIPRSIQLVCLKNRYGVSSYTAQFTYYPQYDYFVEA